MGNHNHSYPLLSQLLHYLQHLSHQFWIQSRGRLIKENHIRLYRQGSGNTNPLLLTARKLGWIEILSICQAHLLQGLTTDFLSLLLAHPTASRKPQCNILQSGLIGKKIVILKDKGCFLPNLINLTFGSLGKIQLNIAKFHLSPVSLLQKIQAT